MSIEKMREQFEAAVIARFKESGFMEVEIRVECLGRSGDGYQDVSVDTYWHFWQASREAVVVELPPVRPEPALTGEELKADGEASTWSMWVGEKLAKEDCRAAIEAQGLKVAP